MNIYFISHYGQTCSWGIAGKQYCRTLAMTGHNLKIRSTILSHRMDNNIPQDILDLEANDIDQPDVVIQNTLPFNLKKVGCYNIGLIFTETMDLNHSSWITNINESVNELWVVSESEVEALKKSGVTVPVYAIGFAFDFNYEPKQIKHDVFTFYFIGESRDRKNLHGALLAYDREFKKSENVQFIIKIDELRREELREFYNSIRLYDNWDDYPNKTFITESLSRQEIIDIHGAGNVLVVPSYGESICLPIYDALYHNNCVICTKGIHSESIFGDKLWYIDSKRVPVKYRRPPVPEVYKAWETWMEPDVLHLQMLMREAFDLSTMFSNYPNQYPKVSNFGGVDLTDFSYEKIAQNMKNRLTEVEKLL